MFTIPVGIVAFLSLHSWRLPIWLSSDPPRTRSKPAVYYMLEDVVAVDFGYGKAWRKTVNERYSASPVFRALMWNLTFYWGLMSMVLVGITAAVVWSAPLQVSFGLVLGDFFAWAVASGFGCWVLARQGLKKERATWGREVEKAEASSSPAVMQEKAPRVEGDGEKQEILRNKADGSPGVATTVVVGIPSGSSSATGNGLNSV
ncbi:hypothetical protein P7C70_g2268, partial [Phenoliferia sp. Uapishka_3]